MQAFSNLVLILLAAVGITGVEQTGQDNELEKKAIHQLVKSYQDAYNEQDATKLAAYWTSDAIYINPLTRETAEGKDAIEKHFKEKFAEGKKRHLEVTTKSIKFVNADEAIANGVIKVTVEDQPPQTLAYEAEYVRKNGKWMIQDIGEIELEEPISNFDRLKDLAWLVGKWEDSDENVAILFDNQWDKHKNFITQHFKMEIYGQDDIEGKQIIAWDPVQEVVRSWVFDSDGGFGEGTWEKNDKSWYATMQFTLGDGRVASSINIYTAIDDRHYTFASEEREVDGEILPDMDPVTVQKIEEASNEK